MNSEPNPQPTFDERLAAVEAALAQIIERLDAHTAVCPAADGSAEEVQVVPV